MKQIIRDGFIGFMPPKSKAVLLMMHGYGTNEHDMVGLTGEFASEIPDLACFSLRAPYENEDPAYAAAGGLQWFSLEQFRPWEEAIMHDDTAAREDDEVFAYIEKSIKEIAELCGMAPENTILLGFSQGAVIASGYAHYSGRKAMGVIALSGLAAFCAKRMKRKTPILVMHGTKDEVVPFTLYEKVKASLTAAEVPAEFAPIQGLGHAINKEEIAKGAVFIKKLLKRLS